MMIHVPCSQPLLGYSMHIGILKYHIESNMVLEWPDDGHTFVWNSEISGDGFGGE